MAKFRIKNETTAHGAISWAHGGKDSQRCEAGEAVTIDWQATAGWGLEEAHYTDGEGNATAIDLETRTFTMPEGDVTIGGTFKRFVMQNWTTSDQSNAGKLLGVGENGNIIPVSPLITAKIALPEDIDVGSDLPVSAVTFSGVKDLKGLLDALCAGDPSFVTITRGNPRIVFTVGYASNQILDNPLPEDDGSYDLYLVGGSYCSDVARGGLIELELTIAVDDVTHDDAVFSVESYTEA